MRSSIFIQSSGDHTFFARKFEAIVNQEIVSLLDAHLYGPMTPNLPGHDSYWESVYDMDDETTKFSNARYSTYQSFLRTILKHVHAEQISKGRGNHVLVNYPSPI